MEWKHQWMLIVWIMNKIEVINESLLDQKVDAIVNPANTYMLHGGGVARQILMKAGLELMQKVSFTNKCRRSYNNTII